MTINGRIDATVNRRSIASNNISAKSKFFSMLIILSPILNQYQVFSLTYLELVGIFGSIILIINRTYKFILSNYEKYYIVAFVTSIVATFFNYISLSNFDLELSSFIIRMIKYIVFFFGFIIAGKAYFNLEFAKKCYSVVVFISAAALFVQYFIFILTGRGTYFILPNIALNYNDGVNSADLISSSIAKVSAGYYYRPSSIFLEPAHYTLFVVPWIILELFEKKKNIIYVGIVSASVLLTTSSLGLLGVLIAWTAYGINYAKEMKYSTRKWIAVPFAIVAVYFFAQIIGSDQGFVTSINIKLRSASQISTASSFTVRLFRGALFYNEIGIIQKLIGVGYGNLSKYYEAARMFLMYDSNLSENAYMSGLFNILNSYGLIGILLYFNWLINVWKYKDTRIKTLLAMLIAFLLTSACYESASYWIIVLYIFGLENEAIGNGLI